MSTPALESNHVFTRDIAAAASLVAIGCKLRPSNPVTVMRGQGGHDDTLFWFQPDPVELAGVTLAARNWLQLLICAWADFRIPGVAKPLDHPLALLKAAAENRKVLVAGVKIAGAKPFKVIQREGRTIVLGADISNQDARRLLSSL